MDTRLLMLGSVPLFQGLSKRELKEVLAAGREVEVGAGADIVQEGDPAMDFYLMLSGEATVTVRGRRRRTLGPGDYFGEIAVIDGNPRTATVTAENSVRALRVERSKFLSLLDRNGSIGRKLLVEVSQHLRAAEGTLVRW